LEDVKGVHLLFHSPQHQQTPNVDVQLTANSQFNGHMGEIPDVSITQMEVGTTSTTTGAYPTAPDAAGTFQLEDKMGELKTMAEGMGLKTSENGY